MIKLTKRKTFKFYRSYFDVFNELEKPEDKLLFIEALLNKQFLGVDFELKGMVKFAYISQIHSIEKQVKGWEDATGLKLKGVGHPPKGSPLGHPSIQEKEQVQVKEEVKEKEEEEVKVYSHEIHACLKNCLLNFPKHLHPSTKSKKNNWLDTIEKLNRIEMLPFESIEMIVKKTRADDFWAKNFLSITKLRKNNKDGVKFVVVFNESIKSNEKRNTNNNNDTGVSDAYMEQIYKDLSTGGRG